ncbi:hypothetical protein CU304_06695 [Prochlorococcus marinus str. MU1415]|nr:hypothetical protein [Prochlorococcus marinus str. MU1415]
MLNNAFLSYLLSANSINIILCFFSEKLTINKRYLDHCSLIKTIVNKMIFVIIERLIFSKALGAWWNW